MPKRSHAHHTAGPSPRCWPTYDKRQTIESGEVRRLAHELCRFVATPRVAVGRPRVDMASVAYGAILREYEGRSWRRIISDLERCRGEGLVVKVPSPKTLSKYMCDVDTIPVLRALLHASATPFAAIESAIAMDSTGFAVNAYERWMDSRGKKHQEQEWVKVHACVGVKTHCVIDLVVGPANSADSPQMPALLASASRRFDVHQVLADAAYSSKANVEMIYALGAEPYIPFASNSTGAGGGSWTRAWTFFTYHAAAFAAVYGQRAQVESTFSAVKRLLGADVAAKNPVARIAEIYARMIAFNLTRVVRVIHETDLGEEFWTRALGEQRIASETSALV